MQRAWCVGVTAKGIVELLIPARAEYLQLVRTVVGEAAAVDSSLDAERIADLRLVVSEAATNAIYAQAAAGVEDRIVVRCNLAAEQIEIEVNDCGAGFDPDEVRSLPAAESPKRLEHESGLFDLAPHAMDLGLVLHAQAFAPGEGHHDLALVPIEDRKVDPEGQAVHLERVARVAPSSGTDHEVGDLLADLEVQFAFGDRIGRTHPQQRRRTLQHEVVQPG